MLATKSDRLAWVDCAKGIGIILVVYTHVQRGLLAAKIANDSAAFAWIDYALFLTHMPLFFALSGLFVGRSIAKGERHFVLSKLQTIVYPYVLWSLIQGALQITMGGSTNHVVQWGDLFAIAWKPFMQFWFLYALFLAQMAALLLHKHPRLLVTVAVLAYASRTIAPGILGDFGHHFLFFVIGMLLADRGTLASPVGSDRRQLATLLLLGTGFVACAAAGGRIAGLDSVAWSALPATILAVAFVVSLARMLRGRAAAVLQLLGRATMTIFVLHTIAAGATRIILVKLGVTSAPLHFVAGTAVGLFGPLLVHYCLERLNLLPWFGLAMFRQAPTHRPPVASYSPGS